MSWYNSYGGPSFDKTFWALPMSLRIYVNVPSIFIKSYQRGPCLFVGGVKLHIVYKTCTVSFAFLLTCGMGLCRYLECVVPVAPGVLSHLGGTLRMRPT